MKQNKAVLRVCASCSWIFKLGDECPEIGGCPKCGFAHYGARYVFGKKCYSYSFSQEPWLNSKLNQYRVKLLNEIYETNKIKPKEKLINFTFMDASHE